MALHMEDYGIGGYEYWGFRGCHHDYCLTDDNDLPYSSSYRYYFSEKKKDKWYEYFIDDENTFKWLCENCPDRVTEKDDEKLFDGYTEAEINEDPLVISGVEYVPI